MSWNLRELREKIRSRLSVREHACAEEAVRSFDVRHRIAAHHAVQAHTLLRQTLNAEGTDAFVRLANAWIGNDDTEENHKIFRAFLESEAHTYAYAQSLHAASDILAKAIFYVLPLERGSITERNLISLRLIAQERALKSRELRERIQSLLSSPEYVYLNAFTNQIKHHSMVTISAPFLFEEESGKWAGLRLKEFEYRGNRYAEKFLNDFVTNEHNAIERAYIEIGNAINTAI